MKTDDLIQALATDTRPGPAPSGLMLRALPVAVLTSLAALVALWHVRPDLSEALTSPTVYKTALPGLLSLAALALARGLSRPEGRPAIQAAVLLGILVGMGAALLYGLATTTGAQIAALLDTPDYENCLISVPALAALPLAAMLWALRTGAPRSPALSGALAGLTAGGAGAAIYSLHCPHDALMYFFPAYGTAMLAVTALGAAIGWKALRW